MITALILVENGPAPLADTISALVVGVAEGVLGDAVVLARDGGRVDAAAREAIGVLADAAGAGLLRLAPADDPWRAGAAVARREWMLCLEAGDVPIDGWARALERFVGTAPAAAPALGRLRRAPRSWSERLAALAPGARRPRAGDVAHVTHLRDGARPRVARIDARIVRPRG